MKDREALTREKINDILVTAKDLPTEDNSQEYKDGYEAARVIIAVMMDRKLEEVAHLNYLPLDPLKLSLVWQLVYKRRQQLYEPKTERTRQEANELEVLEPLLREWVLEDGITAITAGLL